MNVRWLVTCAIIAVAAAAQGYLVLPARVASGGYDYQAFGGLPAQEGGRIKPLDTIARYALIEINSRQSCSDASGRSLSPSHWLLDVMTFVPRDRDSDIGQARWFRIENTQVVQQLKLENRPGSWRYSLNELAPSISTLEQEGMRIERIDEKKRNATDRALANLISHVRQFLSLNSWYVAVLPPQPDQPVSAWRMLSDYNSEAIGKQAGAALRPLVEQGKLDLDKDRDRAIQLFAAERDRLTAKIPAAARDFMAILDAYKDKSPERFNAAVKAYSEKYSDRLPGGVESRLSVEMAYNRAAPLFYSIFFYMSALLLVLFGWIFAQFYPKAGRTLFTAAAGLTAFTFVVHIGAMIVRMYIMNRPLVFVTNLYSSAVFIGLAAVGVGLIVEWICGRGIGISLATVAASACLFIGYFIDLGAGKDNLEMMEAVLDTNFWLATHVTTVTFGYSATFLAGLVGLGYLFLGMATPVLADRNLRKLLSGLVYGMICFATLLSFTGTILGGIWADYSWGRFWGWDPKENGAMLIVLWNALVLHARWSGLAKARGVAVLAVAGIGVTAWSWFGTNQLGVGLHSYGFTSAAAASLSVLAIVVAVCVAIGSLFPERLWLSNVAAVKVKEKAKPERVLQPV